MSAPAAGPAVVPAPAPARVASVDAYRGFVMLLMLIGVTLRPPDVAKAFAKADWHPGPALERWGVADAAARVREWPGWEFVGWQQDHVAWRGCTLHDLIQPSFMFLVGVALPFSLASRVARGHSKGWLFLHALWRSLLLVLLAVVLSSDRDHGTTWVFTNVLAQIGLGYPFLFLLGLTKPVWHWVAVGVILLNSWAFFAYYPLPPADFNYTSVGVPNDWPERLPGFEAHWDKNTNAAAAADRLFLNLFPRREPFKFNTGGYATLNFVPSLATMTLGLIAGTWLRRPENVWRTIGRFAAVGAALLAAGYGLDHAGVGPSVKRIWTPTWVLFSGGWCFLLLAAFHAALDTGGPRGWAFPLAVVGANSIAAYCMPTFLRPLVLDLYDTHRAKDFFELGPGYDQLARGAVLLAAFWLILLWMYRRKIFLRL